MAEGKKSFILYCDQRGTFNRLSDEQAGKLIKHIFSYVNDENPESDFVTELAFEGIKNALKRDLRKYEGYIEKQRENGKRGGRPKKAEETQITQPFISEPKKADSVSVSVNANDTVNDNVTVNDNKREERPRDFITVQKAFIENITERGIEPSRFPHEQIAILFFDNYEAKGWEINGQQIYKWRSLVNRWVNDELKKKGTDKLETEEDKAARLFMEEIKRQSRNEILNGNVEADNQLKKIE